MKITFNAFLLFLIGLVCACSPKQELVEVNIDRQLADFAKTRQTSAKGVCSMIPIKTWDEMVVIGPYTTEDKLAQFNIENLAGIKNKLLSVSYDEGKCMLVYLENKRAIAYSVVSRFPVDFVLDGSDIYSFKNTQCDAVLLKKEQDKRLHVVQIGK